MQVISFTKEVLTLCKDVYEGRQTTDSQMEENAASIKTLLDEMDRSACSARRQTKEEKQLFAVAQKCSKAAEELQKEIRQMTKYQKPADYKSAAIAGYKSIFGKRKIAALYEQFCKHQKNLETHILVRLCTKTDAIQLQLSDDYTQLSRTMKHFIAQMAAGRTDMAHLITRDGTQTREQIQQAENRVKQEINNVQAEAVNEAKRERLLRSLKYETMNSRRTAVDSAHEATYVSMFDSLDAEALDTEHEKTQIGVDRWRPNTLIVSHFFWKPGDILQKNLRGLFCSLNHQLLSSDHTLVERVLSDFGFAASQDTVGDWEITQLKSVFYSILKQCNRSFLLLIDGLDEAVETEEVMQLLDCLIGFCNVKLCISSRGEEVFRQKLSKYDGFKLEDLTRNDMQEYALAQIPASYGKYPPDFLHDLRALLLDKAEGVFLWLVLAIESVMRGLRNNDGQDVIRSRLDRLPSKLQELYAEMWDRLGEDKAIYQREAARYFALLLTNQALLEEYKEIVCLDGEFGWHLNVFLFMLDTNETLKKTMLSMSCQPSVSEMDKECADVALGIPIKTAGLLVKRDVGIKYRMRPRPGYERLREHLSLRVDFLHRTLLDFFLEPIVGPKFDIEQHPGFGFAARSREPLCSWLGTVGPTEDLASSSAL
ncbi:hypothetical protein MKX07_007753 [Trichoderma sp. CBMAI-0711]|nr:hypothetical protein MKX07_007753 [Trichoderma sp. CBMAI-0711]